MIRQKSIAKPTERRTTVHNSVIATALKDDTQTKVHVSGIATFQNKNRTSYPTRPVMKQNVLKPYSAGLIEGRKHKTKPK